MSQQITQLIKMANQIAANLSAASDEDEAVVKTAVHLDKYWTAAMKRELSDYVASEGDECSPLVLRVVGEHLS